MKVVALTRTSRLGPSTRYRIEQYVPRLRGQGIEVETRPLFGDAWMRLRAVRPAPARVLAKGGYAAARLVARVGQVLAARAGDADLVLVEQQLFPYLPAWIETLLWPRRPTILEFDDAIHLTFAHRRKLERLCALATHVLVGNEHLAAFARRTARAVSVVPTTVDPARYPPPPGPREGPFRVGWIGLPYNFASLEVLAGPLARMAADGIDCELRVISSDHPPFDGPRWAGVRVVARPWSEATEVAELQACTVGVMPLPDDEWSRGKCGLKLLQSMAAGLPVVASPIGVNPGIVGSGEDAAGLLAEDEPAWEAALRRLERDRVAAAAMGRAARERVARAYSLEMGARLVADAYRLALAPPGDDPGAGPGGRGSDGPDERTRDPR